MPGEKSPQAASFSFYGMAASEDDDIPRKRLESSRFHEIPVRVELQVRFNVVKADAREAGR